MTTLHVSGASRRTWNRVTRTLGKIWAGVVSLPDRLPRAAERDVNDYPRFPIY
jgi:hypothetical protein